MTDHPASPTADAMKNEFRGVCLMPRPGKKPGIGVEPDTPAAAIQAKVSDIMGSASYGTTSIESAAAQIKALPNLKEGAQAAGTPKCSTAATATGLTL